MNTVGSIIAMLMVGAIATQARALCKWPATLSCPKSGNEPWALLMVALAASLAGIWIDAARGRGTRREETRQLTYLAWGASLLVALLATAQGRTLERGHLVLGTLLILCGLALTCWAIADSAGPDRAPWVISATAVGSIATIAYVSTSPATFEAKWDQSRHPSTSSTITEQPSDIGDLSPLVDEIPPTAPVLTPTPAGG